VECLPSSPCEARLKTLNPATALREGKNVTPHLPESPHCTVQIGGRIGIASGR